MLFSSLPFIFVYLPIVLLFSIIIKPIAAKNYFLLLASLIFYAWGEPKFVIVMITSIVINYAFGLVVEKKKKKSILAEGVVINIAILFVFKYLNFAISNVDKIFNDIIPQTDISLPIGISFFTFQALSYVVDVYRGDAKAQKNILFLGLYISLFPQLIAGPIVRYTQIEKQIVERRLTVDYFSEGVRRFIIGLGKKVIIANNIALIADFAFNSVENGSMSVIGVWLGALSYAMQIYFDFAGYSDMAIGLGLMLGFKFDENFIYPYSKSTIKGFWSENHISLCNWFRDYIYIPLGGSRRGELITYRNMLVVWTITGVWHGASWTFAIWGFVYFILLSAERKFSIDKRLDSNAKRHCYRMFSLIMLILLNGVLFRDAGLNLTIDYILSMFGLSGCPLITDAAIFNITEYGIYLCFAVIYASSFFKLAGDRLCSYSKLYDETIRVWGGTIVYVLVFIVSVSYLVMNEYNPFIYFNF